MYRMEVECMSIIYDTNWFINRIKEKRPNDYDDYVVLGVYKDSHTPIKMYHKVCKKKFDITPNSFLSGSGCDKCGRKRAARKQQISLQEAYNRIPDSYIILDDFVSVTNMSANKLTDVLATATHRVFSGINSGDEDSYIGKVGERHEI